jgi:putative ABC transport system ATP-binding protein
MFAIYEERIGGAPMTPRHGQYRAPSTPTPRAGASLRARALAIALPRRRGPPLRVLDGVDLDLEPGVQVAVAGAPGSGKSTLLLALAGIVAVQGGSVHWDGEDLATFQHHMRDAWRRRTLGCMFPHAGLFPTFDALHNVLLPVTFGGWGASPAQRARARAMLERVGVPPSARVRELSREDRGRVKVVRALWAAPPVVLADEPTAGLDAYAAGSIRHLLEKLCWEAGSTLVVATRDRDMAATFDRRYELHGGKLTR